MCYVACGAPCGLCRRAAGPQNALSASSRRHFRLALSTSMLRTRVIERPLSPPAKKGNVVKKKHLPPQRQTPARYVAPGMTAFGISSSRLGDLVELALAEQLGWVPLVGALAGTQRQG